MDSPEEDYLDDPYGAGQMHVVFKWRSAFEFNSNYAKQLNADTNKDDVKSIFDPHKQTFTLDGKKDDTVKVLQELRDVVTKVFEQDKIHSRNTGIMSRIRRTMVSEFNPPQITWELEESDEQEPSTTVPYGRTSPGQFVRVWRPKAESSFAKMMTPKITEADVPRLIQEICDCIITCDTFEKTLTIHSDSPEVLDIVVRKLSHVESIWNNYLPFQPIKHLVHVPDKKDFRLKILSLKLQSSTIGKTTLFSERHQKYYEDRGAVHSLRLLRAKEGAEKETVVPLNPIKQIHGDRTQDGPRAWSGYLYKGWGSSENNPETYVKAKAKTVDIGRHALNNRKHAAALSQALESAKAQKGPFDTELIELGPRPGAAQGNDDLLGPRPVFPDDEPHGEIMLGPRPNFPSREMQRQEIAPLPAVSKRHVATLQLGNSPPAPSASAPSVPPASSFTLNQPQGQEFKPRAFTAASDFPSPPGEEDNFFPPKPTSPPAAGSSSAVTKARYRVRVAEDLQQATSEVDTREYRKVGKQKQPKKKPKAQEEDSDGEPLYTFSWLEHVSLSMQDMYEAFEAGFTYARAVKNQHIFEARIGRIIFDNAIKATRNMKWTEFNRRLGEASDKMQAIFTDRLTTDFVDADFISDLKIGPAENLFNYDPDKKAVWYEFACDLKGEPCILIFNAESSEIEVYAKLETYGTVYWHYPMSCWDARYTLQSRGVLDAEQPAFRALADTFYTLDQALLPDISFRTENNDIIIKKVYCKRESRYTVLPERLTGPTHNFEVAITEVQDLWIQGNAMNEESFRAIATERDNMILHERLHYTVSVVPTDVQRVLDTQKGLEIGECAEWTYESLVGRQEFGKGLLERMCNVVSAIVGRIDDVGFNNQGDWNA